MFKFDKASASNNDTGSSVKEHKRNASDMSNDETLLFLSTSITTKNQQKVREKLFVCDPNPSLIRILYLPLMNYIREMEELMKKKTNQASGLRTFLSTHIKEQFLAKGHNRTLQLTIEALSKNHDAWRAIISSEEIKALGLTRPLLQSTVLFENRKSFCVFDRFNFILSQTNLSKGITETRNLIQDLPDYSEDLLKMVCSLLKTYRETCQAAYRGIVQPETEDKRIYSVAWLKDDDITRFLKYFINVSNC